MVWGGLPLFPLMSMPLTGLGAGLGLTGLGAGFGAGFFGAGFFGAGFFGAGFLSAFQVAGPTRMTKTSPRRSCRSVALRSALAKKIKCWALVSVILLPGG